MAERIIFPEFRDQFAPTRYPFSDTSTLLSAGASLRIENDTFLDASLYPIGATGRVCLGSVLVEARRVVLTLADERGTELATAEFDPFDAPELLPFSDVWDRPAGVLVATPSQLAGFSAWPIAKHVFGAASAEFVASCVVPTPEYGVRGLLTAHDELLTGDVWLLGENGVVVSQAAERVIRIDIVGDPLFARRLCDPVDLFRVPLFVQTINGCRPDEFGNFNLTVGGHQNAETIVRVYPTDKGLVIEAVGQTVRGGTS